MAFASIEEARTALGLTLDDMSDELGIVRQTYAKWEKNPEFMRIKDARRVSHLLAEHFEALFFSMMVNADSPDSSDVEQ